MRKVFILLLTVAVFGCSGEEPAIDEFTGNEISFSLISASEYGSAGSVSFMERTNGSVDVIVTLDNDFPGNYPVHLHYGDLSVPDAPQATLLSDYNGDAGKSITTISTLADESPFTFDRAKSFDGSIKVHLAGSGPDYDVIISAGNVGSNSDIPVDLQGIANCGEDFEF